MWSVGVDEERKGVLTGSYTPAPGQTMSADPNSFSATSNIRSSCGQSVTSVCWKTALGLPFWWASTTSFASGRSARSAKMTLQPLLRRSFAKQRLMPAPEPVTIAVLPWTLGSAILSVVWSVADTITFYAMRKLLYLKVHERIV